MNTNMGMMQTTNWTAIRELADDLPLLSTDVASSSTDHGPRHWRDVARIGLGLWAEGVDVSREDLVIVLLFAMLHDTQRHNEFSDPEHGERAAALASRLGNSGRLLDWLDNDTATRLAQALAEHDKGEVMDPYDDVAIAVCWDADRLTLPRVGITPDSALLSNPQARGSAVAGAGAFIVMRDKDRTWEEIIDAYESMTPTDLLHPIFPATNFEPYRDARLTYGDDLHPDIRVDRDSTVTIVRSRFVQDIYTGPVMHVFYNARYVTAKAAAEEALAAHEWRRYIVLHAKPYRLDAIYDCIDAGMDDGDVAAEVGAHWTLSENIHEQRDEWIDLWIEARKHGHLERAMDEDERRTLEELPDEFIVYRGFNRPGCDDGLSWTLDRKQAIWFAKRFSSMGGTPMVAEGLVKKDDVFAYFDGEHEIVVLPEDVKGQDILEVEARDAE